MSEKKDPKAAEQQRARGLSDEDRRELRRNDRAEAQRKLGALVASVQPRRSGR